MFNDSRNQQNKQNRIYSVFKLDISQEVISIHKATIVASHPQLPSPTNIAIQQFQKFSYGLIFTNLTICLFEFTLHLLSTSWNGWVILL